MKQSLPYFDGQSPTGYSETTYDSLGRPIRVTRPGPNGTIVQDFDPGVVSMTSFTSDDGVMLVGLAQKEDRQNGQVVYQYKTADGRALVTLHSTAYSTPNQPGTQISGWNRSRYHYDGRGQLRQVTRGIGTSRTPAEDSDLTSSVTYDEWGRRSQVLDPDKGISRYTYTEEGQPLCDTDPDGLTICRSYDTYGRLLSVTRQSDGKILSQYFYDETESTLGTGRLTSVKDESGTRRMHYDGLTGKPARIERTYNALGNEKQFDIENTYDETGALVKRTFPSINVSLRYDYHAGGPLAAMQIEDPDHRILSSGSVLDVVRTSIPDALGNIGTITYGNGVVIQSRYSTTGVLQQVTTQGNGPLSDFLYRWNDEGMLVEKQDLLVADGINRSEQFSYDRSRRLVEATGPYGDRNAPHRTLQYAYGMDGQPIIADEKVYNYDVSNPHRLKSFNQRSYAYDNDTTPDKNKGLVVERRAPGNVVSRFQYHWTGRIKQAQTINGGTVTTVDYEYDTEGNRFIKRTDLGGIVTEIHDLSSDYRIYADGSSEVHTIEIRNGNDPVARFRFQDNHHNSGVWAPSSLFSHRFGADLLRIAALEGGITKLPSLLGFAFSDAYYAVKLLPQIQNKARLLVLLYWTLASVVALAALVLLVRVWRRNPDEGPGLLPVAVYRFGSILALLSFSATGCIVVPQTQDGSEYLLAANGLFRGTSEGGESNIMSVLGAFYYVSTHNGSTDIVTNADGAPVARFVYEPFGKVNSDLTDLDPDRNGVHYGETFMFTGQEYEPETGLYNYKARIYDPETGRFLQPDPVHTERAGFDNWDRYQYANNNPVNFTDPTGESWLSERFKGNWAKKIASGPLGRMWDRTLGKYGFGRWLHQRGVDRWLEGRHLDRWARASLKTAQRMTFVSKKRLNDFGRGLGLATAGILGLAASAIVLPAAVSVATIAVTAAISISVAAVTFACTIVGAVACVGYVLGGLGTSSFNNIHWNNRSAIAGFKIGFGVQAVVGAALCATIAPCAAAFMGPIQSVIGFFTNPVLGPLSIWNIMNSAYSLYNVYQAFREGRWFSVAINLLLAFFPSEGGVWSFLLDRTFGNMIFSNKGFTDEANKELLLMLMVDHCSRNKC